MLRYALLFCVTLSLVCPQLFFSSIAQAALNNRGFFAYDDGAGHTGSVILVYDDDFDITWVGDGNFAQTTGFDGPLERASMVSRTATPKFVADRPLRSQFQFMFPKHRNDLP